MAAKPRLIATSSATVTCSVVARPPRSGVWLTAVVEDALDRAVHRGGRLGVAEVLEHQRPGPDLRRPGSRSPARRCRAPSRAPARTSTGGRARG